MTSNEYKTTGILHSADNLRQLIVDNPALPLVVFAGEDANLGDYGYMGCGYISAHVGEFLDCRQSIDDCYYFVDRDEFREKLTNTYDDFDGTDDEFQKFIENKLLEYEPYWKSCIVLYVDN